MSMMSLATCVRLRIVFVSVSALTDYTRTHSLMNGGCLEIMSSGESDLVASAGLGNYTTSVTPDTEKRGVSLVTVAMVHPWRTLLISKVFPRLSKTYEPKIV